MAPALDKVLNARAFADPVLKQKLTNAGGKGDKNIKTAQLDEVRAELARRVQAVASGGA